MNGVHDMGGMDGFGKVEPEPNEPMFHTRWESRVLAMVRAMGAAGAFNIDTSRFYREALPPHVYLTSSYYKKWLLGLEDMLLDKGVIAKEDIAAAHAVTPASVHSTRRGSSMSGRDMNQAATSVARIPATRWMCPVMAPAWATFSP